MRVLAVVPVCCAVSLAACGASQEAPPRRDEPAARAYVDRLERRLLTESVHVYARLRSTAPFPSDLRMTFDLGRGQEAFISGGGELAGELLSLSLVSDGSRMRRRVVRRGSPPRVVDSPTPRALRESLVLGLTRMGMLHNVVRLASFEPPDHAGGGAADWVRVAGLTSRIPERVRMGGHIPVDAMLDVIELEVLISGRRTAIASLWSLDGLPYRRVQEVRFPEGRMDVHEQYRDFEVGVAMSPDRFVLRAE